jgi:hypothetical protein
VPPEVWLSRHLRPAWSGHRAGVGQEPWGVPQASAVASTRPVPPVCACRWACRGVAGRLHRVVSVERDDRRLPRNCRPCGWACPPVPACFRRCGRGPRDVSAGRDCRDAEGRRSRGVEVTQHHHGRAPPGLDGVEPACPPVQGGVSAALAPQLWLEPQGVRERRGGRAHPDGVVIPVGRRSAASAQHLTLGGSELLQAAVWACRLWGEQGPDGPEPVWLRLVWRVLLWRVRVWRPWDAPVVPMVLTEPLLLVSPAWAC